MEASKYCQWKFENQTIFKTNLRGKGTISNCLFEQNVESFLAVIANVRGMEEMEIHRNMKDHANKISN